MKYKLLAAAVFAAITPQVQGATPYVLEELGNLSYAKHAFVTDMNESGQAIGMAQGVFDIHIDTAALDFDDSRLKNYYDARERYFESIDEEITFTLEDIQNGTINGDAQQFLQDYLREYYTDSQLQKISANRTLEYNVAVEYINPTTERVLFDVEDADYDGLTRSVENIYTGISEDGVKVGWGSAPYTKIEFTPDGDTESETHYIRDFTRRAFVMTPSGERVDLMPIEQTYGGLSIATDIQKVSEGYVVIGESSVSMVAEALERLEDRCDGENQPLEVCYEGYVTSTSSALYNRHATKWVLDNDFNVIDTIDLGLGIIPDEDELKTAWISTALGTNENDIAVGYSVVRYDGDKRRYYPVYFQNGEVVEFIDEDKYQQGGRAVSINQHNVFTGYAIERIEGTDRSKFFYHDIATGETRFPDDFFKSSSVVANDINDNGLIVGQGEVETTSSARRRQEGFIYNINNETFTNLNDLLPCYESDGETPYAYVVSEAIGILNDGTVYGTATKTVDKRDAQGNVVVDSEGKVEQESIVVPVKLTYNPDGVADTCPPKEKETYERQGASTGFIGLLLLPLVAIRRRLFK